MRQTYSHVLYLVVAAALVVGAVVEEVKTLPVVGTVVEEVEKHLPSLPP